MGIYQIWVIGFVDSGSIRLDSLKESFIISSSAVFLIIRFKEVDFDLRKNVEKKKMKFVSPKYSS